MKGLNITNLSVDANGRHIINNLSLSFRGGRTYALVGANGSGKSTLANVIMGNPEYTVTGGQITLDGCNITDLDTAERAKLGLFLAMQYPTEIASISYADFLRTALVSQYGNNIDFSSTLNELTANARRLGFDSFDYRRDVNVGFSGGEKKKSEILQMLALKPRLAILDEPDSGLDKASVKKLTTVLNNINYSTTLIVISHNNDLLNSLNLTATYDMGALQ